LAGSGEIFLREQLEGFATDRRKNALMQGFAKQLTPQERAALAIYYSQLPAPAVGRSEALPGPDERGAWLAERGRWSDDVPACNQCHGPDGIGVAPSFPPLAGLSGTYINDQLEAWRRGERPPGPLGLMPAVAQQLRSVPLNDSALEELAALDTEGRSKYLFVSTRKGEDGKAAAS
jgi:cytochrome c553